MTLARGLMIEWGTEDRKVQNKEVENNDTPTKAMRNAGDINKKILLVLRISSKLKVWRSKIPPLLIQLDVEK